MKNNNSLDMVLSVNGFPLVTIELKNHLTNKSVENAKIQYKKDRDPKELIFQFNKRSLVHFAVDPNVAQKAEIMVEHFYRVTRNKIGGKAKAMVVTSSRFDVTLEYYRIEETFSGDNRISETEDISGVTHAGSGSKPEEEIESLSEIIKIFNEHFGAENFTEGDKLFVDQIQDDMMNDETLAKQAKNNTRDNFKYVFDKAFIKKAMGRMSKNEKVFTKMMNDDDFQKAIKVYLLEQVYEGLQARA